MAGNSNSGRKAKPNGKRTSILIDSEVYQYLRRLGSGSTSLGVELLAYEKKYGVVFYQGETYTLTAQADLTNRQLSASSTSYYDDNEYFEMSAPALDSKGNEHAVYWIFRKQYTAYTDPQTGEPIEAELDTYDYDKPDRVTER